MWKCTFAGMSVQAWQQLSGANVMTYYLVYIFDMAGLIGNIGLISSGISIRHLHHRDSRHPLLHWYHWPQALPYLWCRRHGHLYVRRRRRTRFLRHTAPEGSQGEP